MWLLRVFWAYQRCWICRDIYWNEWQIEGLLRKVTAECIVRETREREKERKIWSFLDPPTFLWQIGQRRTTLDTGRQNKFSRPADYRYTCSHLQTSFLTFLLHTHIYIYTIDSFVSQCLLLLFSLDTRTALYATNSPGIVSEMPSRSLELFFSHAASCRANLSTQLLNANVTFLYRLISICCWIFFFFFLPANKILFNYMNFCS